MIDNLSILLSHALLLFMFYHVIYRDDLDEEAPPPTVNLDADPSRYRPIRSTPKVREAKDGKVAINSARLPNYGRAASDAVGPKKGTRNRRDA